MGCLKQVYHCRSDQAEGSVVVQKDLQCLWLFAPVAAAVVLPALGSGDRQSMTENFER
jgi:hypothetical protein